MTGLGAVELVVDGIDRGRDRLGLVPESRVDRGPDAANHHAHQVDDRGEEELVGELMLSDVLEELIKELGVQGVLHDPLSHDGQGGILGEPLDASDILADCDQASAASSTEKGKLDPHVAGCRDRGH